MKGRKVKGQLETGFWGLPPSSYLLVDAPFTRAVDGGSQGNSRKEVGGGIEARRRARGAGNGAWRGKASGGGGAYR